MSGVTLVQPTPVDLRDRWCAALENHYGTPVEGDELLCALVNFLEAYGWQGSPRALIEALPAQSVVLDFEAMRDVLARLGIRTLATKLSSRKVTDNLCPCLVKENGRRVPTIIVGRGEAKNFEVAPRNVVGQAETVRNPGGGTVFTTDTISSEAQQGRDGATRWFRNLLGEFRHMVVLTVIVAFIVNILSLIGPLSIMIIYDQVIGKESVETLRWLIIGVLVAALFEIGFKICRARIQAYVSAKLDFRIGSRVFEQVLHLPPLFTERAPVSGQVSRLREFDGFRDLFSGPLVAVLVDLPFTLTFLLVLFLIGGPIVAIPVVLAVIYVIIAAVSMPEIRTRNTDSAVARRDRYNFLVELLNGIRGIKQQKGPEIWDRRFRSLSAETAYANHDAGRFQATVIGLSQSIMMASGALTLGFGVQQVIAGTMSLGALFATMMLVWRVLGPLQTLLSLAHRWEQTRDSFRQLIDMLSFRREQEPGGDPEVPMRFNGALSFNRVSMRYAPDANPSLLGVSLDARPGELIAVAGESGSGKSTLLKAAMGLYQPQAGVVTLDGVDLRQIRPITLRQTLAYLPYRNSLFPGSIRDNILLAAPEASEDKLRFACRMAGILHKIEALPHGMDTLFRAGPQSHLPQAFLRQIGLARVFVQDAPVVLLDEPTASMDEDDERYFLRALEVLHGKSTVLMVTQRPSHMRLADRMLYMEDGQVRFFDTPTAVLGRLNDTPTLNMPRTEQPVGRIGT